MMWIPRGLFKRKNSWGLCSPPGLGIQGNLAGERVFHPGRGLLLRPEPHPLRGPDVPDRIPLLGGNALSLEEKKAGSIYPNPFPRPDCRPGGFCPSLCISPFSGGSLPSPREQSGSIFIRKGTRPCLGLRVMAEEPFKDSKKLEKIRILNCEDDCFLPELKLIKYSCVFIPDRRPRL